VRAWRYVGRPPCLRHSTTPREGAIIWRTFTRFVSSLAVEFFDAGVIFWRFPAQCQAAVSSHSPAASSASATAACIVPVHHCLWLERLGPRINRLNPKYKVLRIVLEPDSV
jgi:hypothetical protein